MCGILAAIGRFDADFVATQSQQMSHRGPDERDAQVTNIGTLCHERLAIIDVHTGKQPIQGTRQTWVVHNGEIYNHKQLHAVALGGQYACRTKSDSEVIVHLYEAFGNDFCHLLDGMFSLVVMDEDKGTYLVARDPIGIKPLYYGTDDAGNKWFASEMKALLGVCNDVTSFPPGHYYTPETGFVLYYKPRWAEVEADDLEIDGLRQALETSVEKRLMCDVPFGVLLSGGLDSSLIASITNRLLKARGREAVHSFSIGLTDQAPDVVAAREVAKFIGTQHHEVHFTVEEGIEVVKKLIWHLESYDITTIRASTPMYLLSKYIKEQGIKMVLSGEGADEVFGGYLYFFNAPDDDAFTSETKRRVHLLHTADLLRSDKSTMAHGIEAREPMLDKDFLEKAMTLHPSLRRPYRADDLTGQSPRIEKWVLRHAFDDKNDPYLPDSVLWRQKEQFSDGVGYSWIDGLKAFCETQVSDADLAEAPSLFPHNTPDTKEAFYIRRIFNSYFPQDCAAQTVTKWIPKWQANADPSGRANEVHEATYEPIANSC
jgi:asparagine synthase (glutamine-hydrolysing)